MKKLTISPSSSRVLLFFPSRLPLPVSSFTPELMLGTCLPLLFFVKFGTGTGFATIAGRGMSGCVGVPATIICFLGLAFASMALFM